MRIGFDLDKIFINSPPFIPDALITRLYMKKPDGALEYRIPSKPEQGLRRLSHLPVFRPPIPENLAFLKSIPKDKNKIYLISSRFKFLEGQTNDLVKKYRLDKIFEEMYFNFENRQPHIFKNKVLKKLNLDLYIDDDLSLLNYVAKENKKTKFFWLNHTKKNHRLADNIFAISKLSDIFK